MGCEVLQEVICTSGAHLIVATVSTMAGWVTFLYVDIKCGKLANYLA